MQAINSRGRRRGDGGETRVEEALLRVYSVGDREPLGSGTAPAAAQDSDSTSALSTRYEQWRDRWQDQRERISRRLTTIDAKLGLLGPSEPEFSVVGR